MFFNPESVPGIGRLMLISMKPSEDFRKEHDKRNLFLSTTG